MKEEEIQLTLLHFDFYDVEKEAYGHSATNISKCTSGQNKVDLLDVALVCADG